MSQLQFRPFTSPADSPRLADIINRAFEADRFFKHEQYYDRASLSELNQQLTDVNITYFLGAIPPADEESSEGDLCSGLLITWQIEITNQTSTTPVTTTFSNTQFQSSDSESQLKSLFANIDTPDVTTVRFLPKISTVSVHPEKQGKGLGKLLIKGAEDYIAAKAADFFNSILPRRLLQLSIIPQLPDLIDELYINIKRVAAIELEVLVAVRPDLLPFYSKLGFVITQEKVPFSAKFICLPQYDFDSTMMEKDLQLF